MIRRNGPNSYEWTNAVDSLEDLDTQRTERKWEDFDLRFSFEHGPCSIYVLDANEWFDSRTMGRGPKALYGPALIVVDYANLGHHVEEHHVNSPKVWRWIQARIKDGTFNPANCEQVTENEYVDIPPAVRVGRV